MTRTALSLLIALLLQQVLRVDVQLQQVMVKGADYAVVRPRQSYEALLGQDRLPVWLG